MDTEAATAPEPTTASQPQAGEESHGTELNAESWHEQLMADLSAGKLPEGIEDESNGEPEPEPEAEETEANPTEEEAEQAEAEEEEAEEESEQEEKPNSSRPRLRATNPVEALAFQLKKANKDWSLTKCEAQARLALDIKDEEKAEPDESQPTNEIPDLRALEDRLATLRAERKQAILDFDAEKQAELTDEIDRLVDERPKLQQKESVAQQSKATEFDKQFDAAWERAIELYPDAGKEKSEFAKKMAEIDKELKASNSPLWKEATKAVTIAHMAAKQLLVAPATVKTAPRQSKPVSPLAKGSSATRTSTTQDALEKDIDSIATPDDLERFAASRGLGGLA